MKQQLPGACGVEETQVANDCTSFSPGQATLYYQTQRGQFYQAWVKEACAGGTDSQFILAWRSGWKAGNDAPYLQGFT